MVLVEEVYRVSATFPVAEHYALRRQIRRACLSIPCNIAEGSQQGHVRAFVRFLRVALGSDVEVEVQLELAGRLSMASHAELQPVLERTQRIGRMLNGLIASLHHPPTDHR